LGQALPLRGKLELGFRGNPPLGGETNSNWSCLPESIRFAKCQTKKRKIRQR
jgi:hypothetical protein